MSSAFGAKPIGLPLFGSHANRATLNSSKSICPEWGYVELNTQCGSYKSCFVGSPVGSSSRPLSDKILEKKFNDCVQYKNSNSSEFTLYEKILNIELLQNAQDLFS